MQLKHKLLLLLLVIFALIPSTFAQTQELPSADWYSVVWVRGDDTLHWISPNGEPASIQRPKLIDEAVNANPQLRFSRDGRYMLLVAELSNGQNGIGIYDIQAGRFTQTHQAQPDEIIYLGRTHTSNLSATRVAVGFASSDFDDPSWRIIIFDFATGSAVTILDNETASWEMDIPPSIPVIIYYEVDESIGQEVIHFQMIPKIEASVESANAFKWYPDLDAPADMGLSAYTLLDSDINYLTGEIVKPYIDSAFQSLPAPESGLSYNAIGRIIPTSEEIEPTHVWVDEQRYLYNPLWANSTEWVVFFTESAEEGVIAGWQVAPRDGIMTEKTIVPLPASAREVFGTPNGLLVIDIQNRVSHITSLDNVDGTLLFQAADAQLTQIVFVSQETGVFSLTGVGEQIAIPVIAEDAVIEQPETESAMTEDEPFCEGTLPSILAIGSVAQIANTDGIALRVRDVAGGNVLTEINEGTEFVVVDGPECLNGYTWWQIRVDGDDSAPIVGWSAEGDNEDYWVEVLSEPQPEPTATLIPPTSVPTEESASTTLPEATPISETVDTTTDLVATEDTQVGDGNCSASPESRITVGTNVMVQAAGGTLALRANPLDNSPVAQLPDQLVVPVVGGPACRVGYRQWQIRVTIDNVLRDGWVSEGTITRYFLEPTE
jgi:hypothetical protein